MFGLFGKKVKDKAVEQVSEHLNLQLAHHLRYGRLLDLIDEDPYVAGYIQGKLTSFMAYFVHAEGMAAQDANRVSGLIIMNVFGDDAASVSQAIKRHMSRQTAQFTDGSSRGARAVAYAVGAQDPREDPDYNRGLALQRANERKVGAVAENDHWAAVVGMEQLWFTDRVS